MSICVVRNVLKNNNNKGSIDGHSLNQIFINVNLCRQKRLNNNNNNNKGSIDGHSLNQIFINVNLCRQKRLKKIIIIQDQ